MFCGETRRGVPDGPAVTLSVAGVLACVLTSRMFFTIQTFPAGAVPIAVVLVTEPIIICFRTTAIYLLLDLFLSFLHQSQHQRVLRVGLKLIIFFVAVPLVDSLNQNTRRRLVVEILH